MERVLARLAEDETIRKWNLADEFDEIKALEKEVLLQIESSSLQASAGKLEAALKNANEATKVFRSLKVAVQRNQQMRVNDTDAGTSPLGQPLTTGVNLFDLSIAVKCNLAEQLKNNGQLEQALEMYTQICKLATIDQVSNGGSAGSNRLLSDSRYNQQQQQQQSRSLLYRFGLNIGNVLYEMREFQRALKYYRLTLDRLSTLAGQRNLQIKLMNNITITLMAMNGVIPAAAGRRQGADLLVAVGGESANGQGRSLLTGSRTSDHLTSLELLLADNSLEPLNTNRSTTTPTTSAKHNKSTTTMTDDQMEPSNFRQVVNGNHHRFALNLMVCHHNNSNLAAIYTTLRALLNTNNCGPQFRRVSSISCEKFAANHAEKRSKAERDDDKSSDGPRHGREDVLDSAHAAPSEMSLSDSSSTTNSRRAPDLKLELVNGRAHEQIVRSPMPKDNDHDNETSRVSTTESNQCDATSFIDQQAASAGVDELESLIRSRERQIHRALLAGCNLAIDLEAKLNSSPNPSRSNADGNLGRANNEQTSALAQCCKLATTSGLYRCLRDDLLSSSVTEQCLASGRSGGSLARALFVLEQIALNQQVGDGAQVSQDSTSNTISRRPRFERLSSGAKFKYRSPLVTANLFLLCSLRSPPSRATSRMDHYRTLERHLLDESNEVDLLVNIAKYQMNRDEFKQATELLARLKTTSWPITFNRLLAGTAIQIHPDDLNDLISGLNFREAPGISSSFSQTKMALLRLKLAALYESAGLIQRSNAVLADSLPPDGSNRPTISPELCLLAAATTSTRIAPTPSESSSQPPVAILQQAFRWHPYHIQLAQRLIALHISEFNYTDATRHLVDCIKNRPDQVKWYQMLAECYQRDANYNEAIRIYRYAIESFPANGSCAKALAKLTDELGLAADKLGVS